jgi:hypothetical protein
MTFVKILEKKINIYQNAGELYLLKCYFVEYFKNYLTLEKNN